MSNNDEDRKARRSLVTGMSAAVAGFAISSASSVQAHSQTSNFAPARHEQDSWLDALAGNHRTFIDTSTPSGGADAMRYGFNILNAHGNAYAGNDTDYAMIICFRHASTPFGFNDAIWQKYGENFHQRMQYPDPATGQAPTKNLLNFSSRPNSGTTIDALVARGVQFAICATATRGFAGMLAAATDASADEIFDELVAGAIPNSRFVSAGVMAVTRAQEYNYSLLYAG